MTAPAGVKTPWYWDDRAKRWKEAATGRYIGPRRLLTLRDGFRDAQHAKVRALADRLLDGMSVQQLEREGRALLKALYGAEYMLGRGGQQKMTPQDKGRLGSMLRTQYQYLHDFLAEVQAGQLSVAQIGARLELYVDSATQAHERGVAASRDIVLPAVPGDGSTLCLTRCRCYWRYVERDTEWQCTWTLTATESCETCLRRATEWNPLIVPKSLAPTLRALRRHLRGLAGPGPKSLASPATVTPPSSSWPRPTSTPSC